ncbi:hypothetical protein ACHZ97_09640 [Lysobacter soli]|uniref:hypothetical protein n=1 Tax=Lysobacter soli TaxID=453783 RepID=UPI0037C83808
MYFQDQQQALAQIRLRAEEGGNDHFYDLLVGEVDRLAGGWDSGPLDQDEFSDLIASKFRLLLLIDEPRRQRQ